MQSSLCFFYFVFFVVIEEFYWNTQILLKLL